MILCTRVAAGCGLCILHVCGDDPTGLKTLLEVLGYSPRMWRWSRLASSRRMQHRVFSTYVEMILKSNSVESISCGILHVCGDDPHASPYKANAHQYSPRMWRWSSRSASAAEKGAVFSTYVEMILLIAIKGPSASSILHVCGDDPGRCLWTISKLWVFSTYVEMILCEKKFVGKRWCILHVCGDDPTPWMGMTKLRRVFSTYVEMILSTFVNIRLPARILHVCGDDPDIANANKQVTLYSPRMWRWSSVSPSIERKVLRILHVCGDDPTQRLDWQISQLVFSTYVEMILQLLNLFPMR